MWLGNQPPRRAANLLSASCLIDSISLDSSIPLANPSSTNARNSAIASSRVRMSWSCSRGRGLIFVSGIPAFSSIPIPPANTTALEAPPLAA